jgi:tetratricopeptide (TPR) repeat protein
LDLPPKPLPNAAIQGYKGLGFPNTLAASGMTTLSIDSADKSAGLASRPEERRVVIAICLFLFVATFALFSPAIRFGFSDCDDPGYVTQNLHIQQGFTWNSVHWAFTTGYASNWHPLTWLSHMLDWKLFGDDARGHHADGIFWHSLSAVMAFLLFRRLTGALWTSALAAAIFAWHPLRVESVAWIAERKDVLSLFFGLLSLWGYAAYVQKRRIERRFNAYYLVAFFALAVGLLCKPTLVTIPCLMLVLDYWPLRRDQSARKGWSSVAFLILEKVPFFLLAVISSAVTYHVQKADGAVDNSIPLMVRLSNASVCTVRYLYKFFWPFNLAFGYPYPHGWPRFLVGACVGLLILITLAALMQRRRRPWILVGWLWYLGTLVPVVGIVQVGLASMADRYTYLPMLGIELALLWTVREIRLPAGVRLKPIAAGLIFIALAARTVDQISDWRTNRALYEHSVAVSAGNYMSECAIGSIYFGENNFDDARTHLELALVYKPDYAAARYRLGLVMDKLRDHEAALAEYREVLASKPDDAKALYSLGADLLDKKQPAAAIGYFQKALQGRDDFSDAMTLIGMGMAYAQMHQPQEAEESFKRAIGLNPSDPEAHFDYANLLDSLGRDPEAIEQYEEAIRLNPEMAGAYTNEGNVLRKMGRPADAAAKYRRGIALNPNDADALFGQGTALQDLGSADEAAKCYERAIAIRPDFGDAQYNLGVLLFNENRPDLALAHLQAATAAEPNNDGAFVGLGICCDQLNDHAGAMKAFQRALAINPANADARQFLDQKPQTRP